MELTDGPSFERLTGLALFTPDGDSAAISWGNIELVRFDAGLKSRDFFAAIRGKTVLRKRKVMGTTPIYSIDGSQWSSPMIPDLLLGSQVGDYEQDAGSGFSFVFTATPGRGVELPHVAALISSVMVQGDSKVLGYDFFVDDPTIEQSLQSFNGWVFLPLDSGTIVAGDVVTVHYSAPALALEQYSAFSTLSRDGMLIVFVEDEYGPPALWKWIMDVTVYCKAVSDTQVSAYRTFTMEAAVYGNPIVRRRRQPYGFSEELLAGDTTVIDLS
jgi:hypothetical protein